MGNINEINDELMAMGSNLTPAGRQMPYQVPLGYFQDFATNSLQAVQETEQTTTPSFGVVPDVYSVPTGYFQMLPISLLEQVKNIEGKTTKGKRKVSMPPIRWAMAASLSIILSLGAYVQFSGGNNTPPEKMLSSIPATEISDYLMNNYGNLAEVTTVATNVHELNVDTKEIVQYLNETGWE